MKLRKIKSLSFVELMLSVAVLSLGITLVYQGFLTSLGGYNYCIDYLIVQNWLDEKLWEIQDKLSHYKILLTEDKEGSFVIGNKRFFWNLSYELIEGIKDMSLYQVVLNISWRQGFKKVKTQRTSYIIYKEK